MQRFRLLAISGSLRESSYNTAAIRALRLLAPESIEVTEGDISELPLFNPDREEAYIPALQALKSALNSADGLIIASPEYAHGISGPLKNALDWLVSGAEFPYIPVMLINTSPRAYHAQAALREVLTTMSASLMERAHVSIQLLGSDLGCEEIVANDEIAAALVTGLAAFRDEIAALRSGTQLE